MKDYCEACGCTPCDCGWGNYIPLTKKVTCERCGLEISGCECHWGDQTYINKGKTNAKK